MNETEAEFIQCFGFCGDPISLRLNAMNLVSIVNAGQAIHQFIESNSQDYLRTDLNLDSCAVLEHWVLDIREQIVSLATSLALGCRRLFDSLDGKNHDYDTVVVGKITTASNHDKYIENDQLNFVNACSRLIHANSWEIATACSISKTPGSALIIKSDSGGMYEICLSGFSFAAWMMTKQFSYFESDGTLYTSNLPGLRYEDRGADIHTLDN